MASLGQTRQSIEQRFLQHFADKSPLGDAMRDCKIENFTIEVIEECETQIQANERERFWIKFLNCKVPNGYNRSKRTAMRRQLRLHLSRR